MFTIIIHAANEARTFIEKAKIFARKHFAEEGPRILVRNAEAYDPKQHEAADAIIVEPQYKQLIAEHEDRDVHVIVSTEEELDQYLAPVPPPPPPPAPSQQTRGRASAKTEKPEPPKTEKSSETNTASGGSTSAQPAGTSQASGEAR